MSATAVSSRRRNYMLASHRSDKLIEFIRDLLHHSFVLDCLASTADASWAHVEQLVEEHRRSWDDSSEAQSSASRLSELAPGVSAFWTPLPLRDAWVMYDEKYCVSKRRFVSPGFNDIRHVLNLAQVLAMRDTNLRLVTFDGDCTLYSDGKDFSDAKLARFIALLLKEGVAVALVTAAGYAYEGERYKKRLSGLLAYFEKHQLPHEVVSRFWVLGGECNYLLSLAAAPADDGRLRYDLVARESLWTPIWSPDPETVKGLLDAAESSLRISIGELNLRGIVIRKPKAVGVIAGGEQGKMQAPKGSGKKGMARELLDETVLRLQDDLLQYCRRVSAAQGRPPPFCAFNGGNDVFCDIGNKRVGVDGLRKLLELPAASVLHIGDQFLNTGNDHAARCACPCLWIINEKETRQVLKHILKDALNLPDLALKEPTAPEAAAPAS